MTQVNSSHGIPVNIPATLTLRVTHEPLVLAISNRDLQLERTARGELIVMPPNWKRHRKLESR